MEGGRAGLERRRHCVGTAAGSEKSRHREISGENPMLPQPTPTADAASGAQTQGLSTSCTSLYDPPGWRPPDRTWIRPSNAMAVSPWRGVGIGASAVQRFVAAS